jgi:hypothetical protein
VVVVRGLGVVAVVGGTEVEMNAVAGTVTVGVESVEAVGRRMAPAVEIVLNAAFNVLKGLGLGVRWFQSIDERDDRSVGGCSVDGPGFVEELTFGEALSCSAVFLFSSASFFCCASWSISDNLIASIIIS